METDAAGTTTISKAGASHAFKLSDGEMTRRLRRACIRSIRAVNDERSRMRQGATFVDWTR